MALTGSLAVSEFAELHLVYAREAFGESAMRHGAFMSEPENKVNAYVDQVRQHAGCSDAKNGRDIEA